MNEAIKALCELEPVIQSQFDGPSKRPFTLTTAEAQIVVNAIEALKPVAEGTHVVVSANVVAYLRGEGSLEGKWFDDPFGPFGPSKPYWWRRYLPEVPAAPSAEKDETT